MAILFVDLSLVNFLAAPFVFIHQHSRLFVNINHNFNGSNNINDNLATLTFECCITTAIRTIGFDAKIMYDDVNYRVRFTNGSHDNKEAFLIKCFIDDKQVLMLFIIHEKPLVVIAPDFIDKLTHPVPTSLRQA
eukprot:jgi/Psemu1/5369/gm1.5369_g